MIGLMIFMFFGIYLIATFWVTRATANWARRNHRNPWRWSGHDGFRHVQPHLLGPDPDARCAQVLLRNASWFLGLQDTRAVEKRKPKHTHF